MPVDHSLTFIALVAGVALLCGIAMARLKQPAIVGYIVAGVVLGPSGFGLVTDREQINVLAELGVLMLLFLIGMEVFLIPHSSAILTFLDMSYLIPPPIGMESCVREYFFLSG